MSAEMVVNANVHQPQVVVARLQKTGTVTVELGSPNSQSNVNLFFDSQAVALSFVLELVNAINLVVPGFSRAVKAFEDD